MSLPFQKCSILVDRICWVASLSILSRQTIDEKMFNCDGITAAAAGFAKGHAIFIKRCHVTFITAAAVSTIMLYF